MHPRHVLAIAFLLVTTFGLVAGQTSAKYTWTVFSALNAAQDVAFDPDGRLWIATTGGVVGSRVNDSGVVFRTSDGLLSLNSTAIDIDPLSGDMYVGGQDGTISIRRADGRWTYSTEIAALSERPARRINDFEFGARGVYVATSFGVGLYDPHDSVFRESYLRFDPWPSNTGVNAVAVVNGRIWLATDMGLTFASVDDPSLASPTAWTAVPELNGDTVTSATPFEGGLYVGTTHGVFVVDAGGVTRLTDLPDARTMVRASRTVCVVATGGSLFEKRVGASSFTEVSSGMENITAVAPDEQGRIGLGLTTGGFGIFANGEFVGELPDAPVSNRFTDLALGSDGAVWAASADREVDGAGISRLFNGSWSRFSTSSLPQLKSNKVWNVGTGTNGAVWAGTFGGGATELRVGADGSAMAVAYDTSNSALLGISANPAFILVGKAVTDFRGRVWMTNWDEGGTSGPILVVKLADGETGSTGKGWEGFSHPTFRQRPYKWLAIDDFGTKWVGADQSLGAHPGLVYINDNGTPSVKSDDKSGTITSSSGGLLSDRQTALLVDHDGELWIGTPSGISVLVNPGSVASSGARPVFRTISAVRDQFIRAIAVDALNRKWVGTENGVLVLSFDGVDVLETFTTANSPLVSNDVLSLLAVEATGDVYIGTVNGLSRVTTEAVAGKSDAADLRITPQPLRLPSTDGVRIEGLPENAIVKVLTPSGAVIREFISPGGAIAYWDGLDNDGRPVRSGVYIVAAASPQGDIGAVGKVAVIAP